MKVAILNLAFDLDLENAAALVSRFATLARSSRALAEAGASVTVLQRFRFDVDHVEQVDQGDPGGAAVRWHLRADDPKKAFSGPRARPVALLRLARDLAPDAVLVNGLMFPEAVAELRARLPRTTAIALQHHGGGPNGLALGLRQRALLRFADGFLFTAQGLAAPWRLAGMIRERQPVFEVPESSSDFVPVEREEALRRTGVDGSPSLLWVGRLHARKDPLTAFRAAALALVRLPGLRLFAAFGEEPMRPEVERLLAAEPALAARTRLLGRLAHGDLPAWYSAADLFVTSSPDEGSNYALIEALACGLPAVASDIPPHRALAGESALFFPPGDAAAAADAIVRAAALVEGGAGPSHRIRARFEAELSWSVVARRTLASLDALVRERRGTA